MWRSRWAIREHIISEGELPNRVISVCKFCDMSVTEMVAFLDPDRPHMQQGLFANVQQMYLLECRLSFDEIALRALLGASLKANEFLKLEQTSLADIVAEESGNEYLRTTDQIVSPPQDAPPQPVRCN